MNGLPLNCLACYILANEKSVAKPEKGLLLKKTFKKKLTAESPTATKVIQPKFSPPLPKNPLTRIA